VNASLRTQWIAVALAGLGLVPASAHAAGFYLQEQSARAVGRAFSGEAADTGPDSLWWNPSAIGGTAQRSAYVGLSLIEPSGDVSDTGTLILRPGQAPAGVGGDPVARGPLHSGVLPSGGLALPLNDRIALGFAVAAPFDFTTVYSPSSWARYSALETRLRTYDLQPSVAVAATRFLRLGAGLNIENSDATLANALPNLLAVLPDGSQTLKGNGWNLGWSVGGQLHNNAATLGVTYKSAINHTLSGQVTVAGLLEPLAGQNGSLAAEASFKTPWQVVVGARLKLTPQATFDLQAVRFGWSKFDAIRLGPPLKAALPQDYRDTWSAAAGLDYAIDPRWTVRGGVQVDQTPTRNGARDPRVPDSNRLNLALGASLQATHALAFDLGGSYDFFRDASIDRPTGAYVGTPAQTLVLTSGRLTGANAVVAAFGGRLNF
jgi:long-chain fatty acid transport protein